MRIVITLIVVVGLAVGGYFLWKSQAAKGQDDPLLNRPTTATVEARTINFAVTVAGEIAPAEQVSVRPEINGKIATLDVDVGDRVKKGAVLFTLDDKELQNQKLANLTEIERARLQVEQSDRNYKRAQQLHDEKLISQELFETGKTELALARNTLERSQRDLSLLEERLSKTVIVAPFDCTVLTRPVSVGQAVSGSGGVSGGTEVLTIADLNQMVINAHVNQADVPRLKVGLDVEVAVEAVMGLKVNGTVDRIAPQATVRNNIKGFATRIAIKEIDPRIQPGMTANITIPVASAENVLAVPLGAVFTELGERYVFVKVGEQYERRPVQIGLADYFYAEVMSGLQAGEVVALEQPPGEAGKPTQALVDRPGMPGSARVAAGTREGRGLDSTGAGGKTVRTNLPSIGGSPRPVRSGS